MKITHLLCAALSLASVSVRAEDAPATPYQLSGSVTLASNYLFKGMTQTWDQPALQGSLDLATESGWSASLWASNVSQKVYAGANAEIDLSAGYRRQLDADWSVGGGLLSVFYPGGNYSKIGYASLPSQKYDFSEANVSLGWRWINLKYSYALTDLLGFNQKTGYTGTTRGSRYLDLGADIPLADGYVLNLHAGHQDVAANLVTPTAGGSTNPDFNDYKIGVTRNLADGALLSVAAIWNSNKAFFNQTPSNMNAADTKDVGRTHLLLSYTKPLAF